MHIAVLGATGRVGQDFVQQALEDGHSVTALVRTPEKIQSHTNLHLIQGDVRNSRFINETLREADTVFSALSTDGGTTLTEVIPLIIEGMKKLNLKRIVTIGTAGILQSRSEPGKYRFQSSESKRRLTFAAEEHAKVYEMLSKTDLDWTIVCPTYLPDGAATGQYRVEQDILPVNGSQISVGDTAHFAYHVVMQQEYVKKRVGIAY